MLRAKASALFATLFVVSAASADVERLPMPRVVEKPVRVELLKAGYQVTLTRPAAEQLRDLLNASNDEKKLAESLREMAKDDQRDERVAAQLKLLALIAGQMPALKKTLAEKMGPEGAVIRVYGVEKKKLFAKDRPILEGIVEAVRGALPAVLPPDAGDVVKTALAVAKTTPVYWTIEGRK
jgi:hypothetical protein